ncbi:MAG: class I SAM-dependent methyltransferase, partial [bacterium]
MEFYSSVESGYQLSRENLPTMEEVLGWEAEDPNSIVDARRLIQTTVHLLEQSQSRKGRFLDVGCGYGFFSREAIDRGFEVVALDLAPNKRQVAREMTGLEPIESSFEDFRCSPSSFSAVLMSQILEHVCDINEWLAKTREMLTNDGVVAIALPNFGSVFRLVLQEKSPYISPPEHLNFFNPTSLSLLLKKHGFKVEEIQWVSRIPKWIL